MSGTWNKNLAKALGIAEEARGNLCHKCVHGALSSALDLAHAAIVSIAALPATPERHFSLSLSHSRKIFEMGCQRRLQARCVGAIAVGR